MSKNKTVETNASVIKFIENQENEQRKKDGLYLLKVMREITGEAPRMWGPSLVGFGNYHYKYESGREGDFFKVGFSPRKQSMTLYIMNGFDRYDSLMENLGKYKTGKSCLYVKKIEDIDEEVLKQLIKESYDYMTQKYG